MSEDYKNVPLINNPLTQQFEMDYNGNRGFIQYKNLGNSLALVHTEVDEPLQGKGFAAELVKKTLGNIKDQGETVLPLCPYISTYIKRHPEWNSVVDPSYDLFSN